MTKKRISRISALQYLPHRALTYPGLLVYQFLRLTQPSHEQDMYFCISHDQCTLDLYTYICCVLTEGFDKSHSIGEGEI